MVSTGVLVTVVLAAFGLLGGAFYMLVSVLGARIDDLRVDSGQRFDDLRTDFDKRFVDSGQRLDDLRVEMRHRFDGVDRRLGTVEEGVTGLRAAVAGLDSRLASLEQH